MKQKKQSLLDILRAVVGLPPARILQPVRVMSRDAIIRSRIIMMRQGRADRS